MTNPTLDYSSWLFQLIVVIVVIYLAAGLTRPSLVMAAKRSTVALVAAIALLIAATGFYLVDRKLPGGDDTPAEIKTEPPAPAPQP